MAWSVSKLARKSLEIPLSVSLLCTCFKVKLFLSSVELMALSLDHECKCESLMLNLLSAGSYYLIYLFKCIDLRYLTYDLFLESSWSIWLRRTFVKWLLEPAVGLRKLFEWSKLLCCSNGETNGTNNGDVFLYEFFAGFFKYIGFKF